MRFPVHVRWASWLIDRFNKPEPKCEHRWELTKERHIVYVEGRTVYRQMYRCEKCKKVGYAK